MKLIKWVRWITRIGIFGILPIFMLVGTYFSLASGKYISAVCSLWICGMLFYDGRSLWKSAFWQVEPEDIDTMEDD
ncbi:hypothetical protein FACS189423_01440 [Bacteroidia bacterium]|nr:hypothetical protein FACS189423_01440 [Bacteroidia bacterium]